MSLSVIRTSLVLLSLASLMVGPWAYFAPDDWYQTFPGFGLSWLPRLGPYNEHFAKDIGAMYLAQAALSLITLARVRDASLVRTTGYALTVFNVLHFVYHLTMLDMYAPPGTGS